MRATAVQFSATTDVDENLRAIDALLRPVRAGESDLIVLPEASMHDFGAPDLPLGPAAQPLDGPFVAALAAHARRLQATVVAGMFEPSHDSERPFNTLVALGPDGGLAAAYRKVHLYDSFGERESDRLSSGPIEAVTLKAGDLIVGLMTCYDLRFPEYARMLLDAGADALAVPAAWVRGPLKEDHWETLLRARAIENTVYAIGAGQTGRTYVGVSMIVDPFGIAVARMGDEPGVISADLSVERLREVRKRNPSLANRRLPTVP